VKTQLELPAFAKLIWSIPGGKHLFFILVGIAVILKEFLRDKEKVLQVNKVIFTFKRIFFIFTITILNLLRGIGTGFRCVREVKE
jgi:hypothetical protein